MKKYFLYLIFLFIFLNIGNYLDLTNSTKQSDIIVVLGGGKDARIKKGLELYNKDYSLSNKILFTGSDLYDEVLPLFYRSAYLIKNGVKETNIIHIDQTIISNTMEELFEVKKYLIKNNMKSVLFVSHPTHSRRINILANTIANYDSHNIKISFAAADHTGVWNKDFYFLKYDSIKLVFSETIKIFYNLIKYTILLKFT